MDVDGAQKQPMSDSWILPFTRFRMQQEGNINALKGNVGELTWKIASNSHVISCKDSCSCAFICLLLYYLESGSSQKFPEVSC